MAVVYNIENWREEAIVATIGFFDGVHLGHCYLLGEMQKLAKERHLPSAVVTFTAHPRKVLQSDYQPKLLNSFDEKIEQLSRTGVDYIIILDFTISLAALSAREFITSILSEKLHVSTLFIGYDHRFGYHRAEGFEQYIIYGKECGMEVVSTTSYTDKFLVVNSAEHQPLNSDSKVEKEIVVSSTKIRNNIAKGDVSAASRLLGYPYRLKGHIINGYKIGRKIGFPTANIELEEKFKIHPLSGSYAVWVIIDGCRYRGMLYIGSRPTLDYDDSISIEVNIFDFSEDIYNKSVIVEFVDFIREDMKFDSLDDLRAQMCADKQNAEYAIRNAE